MSVTFKFDTAGILDSIEQANREAIAKMGEQVLADSNFYCKLDQGTLIAASLVGTAVSFADCGLSAPNVVPPSDCEGSDLENGIITWDQPYAQNQYYFENAYNDKNTNAQMMWFHKAKDVYGDQWITSYQNAFNRARRK